MQNIPFSDLGLSPEILKAVAALGFEQASPIQAAAIPILLTGKDAVGQSQTGSGKTAAFAIPAIERVDSSSTATQILILCPTRELATQVAEEVHKLSLYKKGVHAVPIYGGASYERQFYELKKGVQIVIGTPGRVIDHLERGTLKIAALKMVVLDEADRMLDMGFRDDIQKILDATPKERQTVFFSATISKQIKDLINRYARDPQTVRMEQKEVTVPTVEQWFYEVSGRRKIESLIRLIDFHEFKLGIVFCNTQRMVDELAEALIAQGISADRLHGGISQAQRTRVMNNFKKAEFEFLVATDVAGRGIDVDDLELVVNYDLPYDAEDYVHRIGRTGRAGKRGMAVTFVSGRDIYKLQYIERFTRTKIKQGKLPTADEVEVKRADAFLTSMRTVLGGEDHKRQAGFVERLLEEGYNSTDIAAAALHLLDSTKPSSSEKSGDKRDFETESKKEKRPAFERDSREPREPREPRPLRERTEERTHDLKRPPAGMQWVTLDAGRKEGIGPREIVALIEHAAQQSGARVGHIELSEQESFAQVPHSYADALAHAEKAIWNGRQIIIKPLEGRPSRGGDRSDRGPRRGGEERRFTGKFGDKKKGFGKGPKKFFEKKNRN